MTTYLNEGMTVTEMRDTVIDSAGNSGKPTEVTTAYKYLNLAQLALLNHGDWPELIQSDDYFTTTGAASYDLRSVLHSEAKTAYCRPVDRTVRIGSYFLEAMSKPEYDNRDPERIDGNVAHWFCQYTKTDFRLFPYGSSGETCNMDWVIYPEKLADGSSCSFYPERHNLIVLGAIWMFQRDYYPAQSGYPEWLNSQRIYERELKTAWKSASLIRKSSSTVYPISC